MLGKLDDLDEPPLLERARDDEAGLHEPLAIEVVHLIAVPVSLQDHRLAVQLARLGAPGYLDRLGAEAHRAAEILDSLLLRQEVDHRVRRLRIHLGRVRAVQADDVPSELGDRDVHAEADAEIRDPPLARDAACEDLALPPARAKAARHQHAVDRLEQLGCLVVGHILGVDPAHPHGAAAVQARVLQRLVHRQVRVLQLHVLPDERDLCELAPLVDPARQLRPFPELRLRRVEPELVADEPVEPLLLQHAGDEVHVRHVRARDHSGRVDIGEERDLVADVARKLLVRAADDHVRMDADAPQLVHRVLGRLRLQLPGRLDERHERHVHVDHVFGTHLAPELADRLEKRQRLDVADRAADLGDHDVDRPGLGGAPDPRLDLVRDVRDHLDGGAEEVALALLAQDGRPDGAGAMTRVAQEVLVDEALVVADVEVGLRPVLGHVHLAVLERAHRSRVDVQVRVELLQLHPQPARLEQAAERGGDDSLPERRDHSPGNEDVLRGPCAHGISG